MPVALCSERPPGSPPCVTAKLYPGVPPVTLIEEEYEVPATAAGRGDVATCNGETLVVDFAASTGMELPPHPEMVAKQENRHIYANELRSVTFSSVLQAVA